MHTMDPIRKRRRSLRPVRTPPAHPSAARARGLPRIPRLPRARRYPRMPEHPPCKRSAEDAGAPACTHGQDAIRGCRSSTRCPPASQSSRMPGLRPVAPAAFPRPWTPRMPWTPRGSTGSIGVLGALGRPWTPGALGGLGDLGCQGVLGDLGDLGDQGVLGVLGVDGERRDPWTPWAPWRHWRPRTPRTPWSPGCPWRPRTPRDPRGRWGASEGPGAYNCKNGFQNMFLNHRFQKKSRKSYQNFRNNSKSQTMKSAQDFFYRFWDRAIMTQSIIAVFANRGGASAQYRTKKVSHN